MHGDSLEPPVSPNEEAWRLGPRHGELAVAVMLAQPTLDEARRVYKVFDAVESKMKAEYGYAAWVQWLTRTDDSEDEGWVSAIK